MARPKKDIASMYKSPFPIALRELMSEEHATTQEKLAEITGKTRQTVSQYVNGISEPGYDTLIKIADYFDVSIDYLLGRTKDRRKAPSVYDQIGLSEHSISLLRLAHESSSSTEKLIELVEILAGTNITNLYRLCNKEQDPSKNELVSLQIENDAKQFARTLPRLIDDIISIAAGDNILIPAYSKILNPDSRPVGLSDLQSRNEYVDYRIYQVANVLTNYLRGYYIETEVL